MAAINQRIPNFLGGVSQQPDKIKFPGQLRVCDNAVPDVTFGLRKRPPAEFVGTLSQATATGHWYNIIRDGDEKYIVQITPHQNWSTNRTYAVGDTVHNDSGKVYVCDQAGTSASSGNGPTGTGTNITDGSARWDYNTHLAKWIRIWDLATGTEQTLTNPHADSLFTYLAGATSPYAVTTIQDYTLIANPDKVVGKSTATTPAPINNGDYSFARLDTVAYNTEYILYTGTAPTPNTFFRVTSVKVDVLGIVNKINVTARGANYTSDPTVTISGGGGSGATARAERVRNVDSGYIFRIVVTNPGSGYTSAPTVSITGGNGSGATATAEISNGPTWNGGDPDQSKAGTLTWSFSGGDSVDDTGAKVGGTNITENIEGSLQVNGSSYVESNSQIFNPPTSDSNGDFLGFEQNYAVRYTATVTLRDGGLIKSTNQSTAEGMFIDVTVEGIDYRISVEAVEPVTTYQDVSNIGYHKTPKNPENGAISMATILNGLKSSVNSNLSNVTAEVIGSGLYMHGSSASGVNFLGGAVNENMSVIGQRAQDITRLPAMNKQGYVAQISNAADLETDDYYVKFEANNGTSGSGSYEETVRPHNFDGSGSDDMLKGFDPATMPHALINNRNGTFSFVKLDEATANTANNDNYWKDRDVGDDVSNPYPTFTGNKIQKMFFHRNRLGFVSGENIILSQPGSYFNFFIVSAISFSDDNPIDITVSDVKPAFINHILPIQKGLMMFSDNGQFLLFTESDIFSPKTARLKKLASYECDSSIQPVDLGTSILFTSNVAAYARAFEATIIDDDTPPQIIEQTRVVPEFLPKDITQSANSTAIGIVSYSKKGDSSVYHYKYYNAGNKREQSAWYSWTLTGTTQHTLYTGGSFFAVTLHDNTYKLCRYEYVTNADSTRSYVLGGSASDVGSSLKTARQFEAHLDMMTIGSSLVNFNPSGSEPLKTRLTIPYIPSSTTNLFMVGLSGDDADGNSIAGIVKQADQVESALGLGLVTFHNINLANNAKVAIGYKYTSIIELPTYYLNVGQNVYDVDGDLRISGINFELGVGGPIEFHLTSPYEYVDASGNITKDIDDYVQFESGILSNSSVFNEPPAELARSVRVPIQRKNEKYTLQIRIPDPFSTAIISGSWDGIYHNRRHVRR